MSWKYVLGGRDGLAMDEIVVFIALTLMSPTL
jgi:hypothetical protein